MTVTKKRFSWSSAIAPAIDPTAQHSALRGAHRAPPLPSAVGGPAGQDPAPTWARRRACIWASVSSWSRWAR